MGGAQRDACAQLVGILQGAYVCSIAMPMIGLTAGWLCSSVQMLEGTNIKKKKNEK
jgi:hypothetical protein